jgi:hypothetical protein
MKYLAYLPDRQNYNSIPSNRPDQYWFVDKASIAVRVRSPIANPFDRLWVVVFSPVTQENDRGKYPIKLDLKLKPVGGKDLMDLLKVAISRSVLKGSHIFMEHQGFVIPLRGDGVLRSLIYQLVA